MLRIADASPVDVGSRLWRSIFRPCNSYAEAHPSMALVTTVDVSNDHNHHHHGGQYQFSADNTAAYEGLPIFLLTGKSGPLLTVQPSQEMRVNWATSPGAQTKVDTSKHFHIFIGDLSPEIDNKTLRDAFAPFGEISDVKVIRDLQTMKSKGYGFVSFVVREDAERAIEQMNGQWLGRRTIRTNWATRKPGLPGSVTFEDVMNQSSPNNSTVYVGGVGQSVAEDDLRRAFSKYGGIVDIRVFKQQGYAFVRYETKEAAAHAIMNVTGTEISGCTVRCSWGKEGNNAATAMPTGNAANAIANYGFGYAAPHAAPPAAAGYGSYSTPPPPPQAPNAGYGWSQYFPPGPAGYYPPNPGMYPPPPQQQQQQQTPWQNYWPPAQGHHHHHQPQ